ncbi:MAG: hypothetical protein EU547_00545 [Promethearchaeota archaeon]|nr:MAG: hypothetical protein EU547_00545 [Candidatus Lokiarchaeota archaeon]
MYYIIILIIWLGELIILPFCSDTTSVMIISAPFFITLPLIIGSASTIPEVFSGLLVIVGILLSIVIFYQIMTEVVFS